jgi:CheY-like chemotaxis protein/anti-sigma regulatory factor (Ser/Thr protein kinase)
VVSRLRDFYRPREVIDVFSAVNINDILEELVALTRPKWHDQALQTGRSIRLELELQKVPPVHGNGAELRESLMNLVFNAVDALPNGGTITLRSAPIPDGVQIEVSDTGTGMTEEVRQRCLEPFFSTKGDHGTGLGLPMVCGIIRRHEGSLAIDTASGTGTTFRVFLPCHHADAVYEEEAHLTLHRSLRVLVVDDEPNVREVVSGYLRGDGHRVTTAVNGGEAMQRIMSDDIDLVITDYGMPGMDGIELAGAVRRVDAGTSVILLTGFGLEPEQQPASIDFVLQKPLVPEELRTALRSVVVNSRHGLAVPV